MLVLELSLHIEAAMQGKLVAQSVVLPLRASRDIIRADGAIFVADLQSISWRNPIGDPRLEGGAVAANRITEHKSVVGVAVRIVLIPIIKIAIISAANQTVLLRVRVLDMKI